MWVCGRLWTTAADVYVIRAPCSAVRWGTCHSQLPHLFESSLGGSASKTGNTHKIEWKQENKIKWKRRRNKLKIRTSQSLWRAEEAKRNETKRRHTTKCSQRKTTIWSIIILSLLFVWSANNCWACRMRWVDDLLYAHIAETLFAYARMWRVYFVSFFFCFIMSLGSQSAIIFIISGIACSSHLWIMISTNLAYYSQFYFIFVCQMNCVRKRFYKFLIEHESAHVTDHVWLCVCDCVGAWVRNRSIDAKFYLFGINQWNWKKKNIARKVGIYRGMLGYGIDSDEKFIESLTYLLSILILIHRMNAISDNNSFHKIYKHLMDTQSAQKYFVIYLFLYMRHHCACGHTSFFKFHFANTR